jgi:diguanylate cyclase (GGDEF)-like protein
MDPIQFTFQQTLLFLLPVLAGTLIAAGNAIYAWMHRDVKGAQAFMLLMVDVALWSLFTGGFDLSPSPEIALIWYKLRLISVATAPVIFLIFSLQFTDRDHLLSQGRGLLLFIVPFITQVGLWLVPDFFVSDIILKLHGSLMVIESDVNQVGFFIHFVYAIGCFLTAITLLVIPAFHSQKVFRGQALVLLVGGIPTIVVSAVMASFFSRSNMQLIPLSLSVSGVIFSWALFHYRLLDLVPGAKTMLIRSMDDGLLVFDNHHWLVEMNPAAEMLLGHTAEEWMEGRAQTSPNQNLMVTLSQMQPGQMNIQLAEEQKHFEARAIPLTDRRGRSSGRMVILHDITELFQATRRLGSQLHEIQVLQFELKINAVRDDLTGLYTRHTFDEFSLHELARAVRERYQTCFAVVEVDHIQSLTDLFGREAADTLLRALAVHFSQVTRQMDMICRLDSQRIMIMLPKTSADEVYTRAEEWRKSFQGTEFIFNTVVVRPTVSIGIACYPAHGETIQHLVDAASQALALAQEKGFNRTENCLMPARD